MRIARTIVIAQEAPTLNTVRARLLADKSYEPAFRFEPAVLARARRGDVVAVEQVLDRWDRLDGPMRERLAVSICEPLAGRLQVTPPEPVARLRFLRDFLLAAYRREYRHLG